MRVPATSSSSKLAALVAASASAAALAAAAAAAAAAAGAATLCDEDRLDRWRDRWATGRVVRTYEVAIRCWGLAGRSFLLPRLHRS